MLKLHMVYHSNIALLCIYFSVLKMSGGGLYMVQCNIIFFDILGIEYSNWKVAIDIRHSLRFLVFYIFMVLVSAKLN
jgi:hypothetical protein